MSCDAGLSDVAEQCLRVQWLSRSCSARHDRRLAYETAAGKTVVKIHNPAPQAQACLWSNELLDEGLESMHCR